MINFKAFRMVLVFVSVLFGATSLYATNADINGKQLAGYHHGGHHGYHHGGYHRGYHHGGYRHHHHRGYHHHHHNHHHHHH